MRDTAAIIGVSCSLCMSCAKVWRKTHKMVAKTKATESFVQQQKHENIRTMVSITRALRPGPRANKHKDNILRGRKRPGLLILSCPGCSSCAARRAGRRQEGKHHA